jgi:hypothetical protein
MNRLNLFQESINIAKQELQHSQESINIAKQKLQQKRINDFNQKFDFVAFGMKIFMDEKNII